MQKTINIIKTITGRIIFIGLSVQIALGLLWMCGAYFGMQEFAESFFYLKVSDSLLCDEYTGIIYPFLLMLVRGIADFVGGSYIKIIYMIQLICGCLAGYCFLESLGLQKVFWKIWGTLALLTFPMAMQCHMAILPNSLAFSVFLILLACVFKAVKCMGYIKLERLVMIHVFWLLAALIMPEYLFLGAVPVIGLFLYYSKKFWGITGRKILYHLVLIIFFAGMTIGAHSLTQEKGCYGRVQNSVEAALFRRTAWTSLAPYYPLWPEELKAAVTNDEFALAEQYAENMSWVLQPKIELILGVEEAREWFGEFARQTYDMNYPHINREILWDAVGHAFPIMVTDMLLDGRGYSSYVVRNYEAMRQAAPTITKFYMDYSVWWFPMGMVLTLGTWICCLGYKKKKNLFPAAICILSAGAIILWYTMQDAGLWDYKESLFAGSLWTVWMILMAGKSTDKG